ncbi:outer membrane protein assembly factor BamA [Segnochrobactraceae bacterium EtOH-i3]
MLAVVVAVSAPVLDPLSGPLGAGPALAETVGQVIVTGNKRVDAETIRTYVSVKPGRPYGAANIDESLQSLYATGLFADVKIVRQGNNLVVSVVENPIINKVAFEGNKKLTDEQLQSIVESTPRSVMTKAKVQGDVQRILESYRRSGRFRATVDPKVIELSDNRVDLVYEIDEGDKTGVSSISFIGNKAFSDGRLLDVIKTRESGILSWIRTSDTYDPDRLQADEELLRRFYYNNGYADFRIVSTVADLDRERNSFFITFTLEEGDKYDFGEINVESSLQTLNPDQLRKVVKSRPGKTYSAEAVEKSIEALTIEAAKAGYAFAQVRPRGDRNFENHTISVTYSVEEGPRVYVERLNIRGNTRTRDFVIRREFELAEGDAYNRVLVDRAERRLNNLGFFKTVRITTEPGSAPDRVVVNVDVEEQSTGEVSFGIGYSSSDGVIGDVSVSEKNFLGRGQYVRIAIGGGESQSTQELSFTEPFFLGRRLAAGFDLYNRQFDHNDYRSYDDQTTGGNLRFALPVTDQMTFNVYYTLYNRDLSLGSLSASEVSAAVYDSLGESVTSMAGFSLVYNALDNNMNPRDGFYARLTQDFAGIGGDVAFSRTKLEGRYYQELYPAWGVVGMLKAEGGIVQGLGQDLTLPDQFFIGGETIRGFASSGIGPRDSNTDEALGGQYYIAGSAEAVFPIPYLPQEVGFSGAVFSDMGTLWNVDSGSAQTWATNCNTPSNPSTCVNVVADDAILRWTAGFGVLWKSPFGPIRADFAWPITMSKWDQPQVFRLGGGTRF